MYNSYKDHFQYELDNKGCLKVKKDIECKDGLLKAGSIIEEVTVLACNSDRSTCTLKMKELYGNTSCEAKFEDFRFEDWLEVAEELNQLIADGSKEEKWDGFVFLLELIVMMSVVTLIFDKILVMKVCSCIILLVAICFIHRGRKHLRERKKIHEKILKIVNGNVGS